MVGVKGFEPSTFSPQTRRSNQTELHSDIFWSTRWDLNPQHFRWQRNTLPIELLVHFIYFTKYAPPSYEHLGLHLGQGQDKPKTLVFPSLGN
jgi:hypothetical protein